MSSLFITGMARSGTTLLDKLLHNHSDLSVLSQPFPLIYIELKKQFLKLKGHHRYYVLNEALNNGIYDPEELNDFLSTYEISSQDLKELFNDMADYSGQLTRIKHKIDAWPSGNLIELFNSLVKLLSVKSYALIYGSKEILCEEFLPFLTNNNVKVIVIIRDPRDVLASTNYPSGRQYLGTKRPSLFVLRAWRKSVDFIEYLKNNPNFYFLKYEDLVSSPYAELDKITNFLGIKNFEPRCFDDGIFDQNGKLWKGNSSNQNERSVISRASVGIYMDKLSKTEIAYTEAICRQEMESMNYSFRHEDLSPESIIKSFEDYGISDRPHLAANYSSNKRHIEFELNRLRS